MRGYIAACLVTVALVLGVLTGWSRLTAGRRVLPVATTASLSIAGPSFTSRDQAVIYAGAIETAGHPAFVRFRPDERRHQVLVGPFVASAEAQAAQRTLARRGLADTRLMVDDSMRSEAERPALAGWRAADAQPRVVAAAAPGLLTVVIETDTPPTEVRADRVASRLLDIHVRPATAGSAPRRWSAPAGTLLLEGVQVLPSRNEDEGMRVRLEIPEEAITRVRLEARRVYVDIAWPDPPWPEPRALRALRARQPRPVPDADRSMAHGGAVIEGAIARFRQLQPFLLSAVATPDPSVLEALGRTLDAFPDDLPAGLRAAIAAARAAVAPDFAGDRQAEAMRSVDLLEDAAAAHAASQTPPTASASTAAMRIISR
jgi:hypothetical protein